MLILIHAETFNPSGNVLSNNLISFTDYANIESLGQDRDGLCEVLLRSGCSISGKPQDEFQIELYLKWVYEK